MKENEEGKKVLAVPWKLARTVGNGMICPTYLLAFCCLVMQVV